MNAPRSVEQRALREQVSGRVAADMAGVRGQVEQLLLAREHDLDLLDGAAIALEPVVDARAHEPAAELRERPVERRALADRRVAVLEDDLVGPAVLDRGHRERRALGEDDLGRPVEEALRDRLALGALDVRAWRDLLLDDRRRGAAPSVTTVRVISARPGAAVGQRRVIGSATVTPGATSTWRPWIQKPRASIASLSSGERRAALQRRSNAVRVALQPVPERLDVDACRDVEAFEVVAEPGGAVEDVRVGVFEGRRPQVDVRRVQLVRLDRQCVERVRGGQAIRCEQPVGLAPAPSAIASASARSANRIGRSAGRATCSSGQRAGVVVVTVERIRAAEKARRPGRIGASEDAQNCRARRFTGPATVALLERATNN